MKTIYYHLPGLFEFYELYREFLPLFRAHREYFYDWCEACEEALPGTLSAFCAGRDLSGSYAGSVLTPPLEYFIPLPLPLFFRKRQHRI